MPDETTPMPDEPETPAAPAETGTTAETAEDNEFKSEHSKNAVLADLKRERDSRKALEERLKEYEDRDKSEAEKAADRVAAAERAALDAQRDAARFRVAHAKGVDPELLAGVDHDVMEDHADRLLAWREQDRPTGPKPDGGQGARPLTPEQQADLEYQQFYPPN